MTRKKPLPTTLYEAFVKVSDNGWESEELYEAYRKEAEAYLGEDADRMEFAKLVVPLARIKMGRNQD